MVRPHPYCFVLCFLISYDIRADYITEVKMVKSGKNVDEVKHCFLNKDIDLTGFLHIVPQRPGK